MSTYAIHSESRCTTRRTWLPIILVTAALWLWGAPAVTAQVTVSLDPAVRFQTIEGWGHGSGNLAAGWAAVDSVDYQYIDYLTDDWGLTGTRITEVGPRLDGSGGDNGDCDSIDWTKFEPGPAKSFDYMAYFRNRVLAEGYRPSFYSSPGYASLAAFQKPWILNHPGERAQQIVANALYWKEHYGVEMNYAVIINEPTGNWTPKVLADDIEALGPRLAANGLGTRIQFPEAVAPKTSWDYITAVQADSGMWPYVGRLSYHNYGTADPYRSQIREFGASIGIPTAQTEMDPNNIDNLFDDLLRGGVTYWEVAFSSSNTVNPNPGYTSFTPTRYYFRLRQVLHYVRPGAVRIGAQSSDTTVRVLAFVKGGAATSVIYNTSPATKSVTLHGVPSGRYGLSQAANSVIAFQELGVRTVADSGTTLSVPSGVVATLYPYAGPNLPPTIMTWGSTPGVVEPPATTSSLSVTANDPERDPLTYRWSVVRTPAGANVALATPDAATTTVSGLTAAGTYVFNVEVRDGINTTSKQAYLVRYESNQPPVLGYTGFRLAAPYGVVLDLPRADGVPLHTNIALPTSSGVLQANISDLENDTLTAQWTVVSQPPTASVALSGTISIYASFRSNITNMTVPGDYVFQIAVSDRSHAPVIAQVICTVHPQNTPPVIGSVAASPGVLSLPATTTQLTATTSDREGDLLRHWWVVKSAPAGAHPTFAHQGLPNSEVGNLTVPGIYTFTLRAFDDISMTTKDVAVTVRNTSAVERPHPGDADVTVFPNPCPGTCMVSYALDAPARVRIELYDEIGQLRSVLADEEEPEGQRCRSFELGSPATGEYFICVRTGSRTRFVPLRIQHDD
ncbi:MAG TPA: hypothetical protein VHI13_06215 [Candidatus Kapabacteria bacterium]|nr:hypothetical protein [Candidatus Kapabacteria bacterium]